MAFCSRVHNDQKLTMHSIALLFATVLLFNNITIPLCNLLSFCKVVNTRHLIHANCNERQLEACCIFAIFPSKPCKKSWPSTVLGFS